MSRRKRQQYFFLFYLHLKVKTVSNQISNGIKSKILIYYSKNKTKLTLSLGGTLKCLIQVDLIEHLNLE